MAANNQPGTPRHDANDAARDAHRREHRADTQKEAPVKQHNPGDRGMNPGQLGPAQPGGSGSESGDERF